MEVIFRTGQPIFISIAAGAALSVDGVIIPDADSGKTYLGASVAGGFGGGADFHVVWGPTLPAGKLRFNIFDVLEELIYNESR